MAAIRRGALALPHVGGSLFRGCHVDLLQPVGDTARVVLPIPAPPRKNLPLLVTISALGLAVATGSASAQSSRPALVSVSSGAVLKDGSSQPSLEAVDRRSVVPAVAVTVGKFLSPWFAVEGSVEFQASQSFGWRYTYAFDQNSEQLLKHRDIPLVARARFSVAAGARARIEPFIGIGVTRHSAVSTVTALCAFGSRSPCVPVAGAGGGSSSKGWELLTESGISLPFRISSRLSVGPTARLAHAKRPAYLTQYLQRGPVSGSGVMAGLGIAVTWSDRSDATAASSR